jgi:hypothetical protein
MKGRSPWNRPSVRKTEAYTLLMKLGGNARWRDLKSHLAELGWGPTTLKRTLDEMLIEGTITKEARLGEKGPEAWYTTRTGYKAYYEPHEIIVSSRTGDLDQMMKNLQKRLMESKHDNALLKTRLEEIVKMAGNTLTELFYLDARHTFETNTRSERFFDLMYEGMAENQIRMFLQVCLEYPKHMMEVCESLLEDKGKNGILSGKSQ